MITLPLPGLHARDVRRIGDHAAAAEARRFLHPVQQALLHRRGWLKMLAPRSCGGAELPLPDVVRLEEAVASIDGSMGWVLTLCAGAGWFAGFLPPPIAADIMHTRRVCVAGSGAPTGYAEQEGDGYRISGSWDYASGAPMGTHFTLNAVLRKDGQPMLDASGQPSIRAFIVPVRHVSITPSWSTIGMRATATHRYAIDGAWVPKEHGFTIAPEAATADGPLYRFPFMSLAYVTLAANIAGMAAHFLRLASDLVGRRQDNASAMLSDKMHQLAQKREHFYQALDRCWKLVEQGRTLASQDMDAIRATSLALVAISRCAVDELYPYCGLYAAREDTDINRVWRDFHTAIQHKLFTA
ncbi:acyl-CoA dehydrogenase [Duganella callida]|uniref:Acyl-CoA dehydrogenase n=1 Tax=Duganella callida TaxID=2561932 RepID=A0A4Y9SEM5_9BURK|nr:acyl-CoA dehydrogenase [Duganella callida]TFW21536.1 acyl-CoA dehydrogenase [Duganella callida]